MSRTNSKIDNIHAELSWVAEEPDPNRCGCRHMRCCKEKGHKAGECSSKVETKLWTFRWEYYCRTCRVTERKRLLR